MSVPAAAPRRIELFVFLGLAQVLASLLARSIHEVVGHGLVAEMSGGDFILFFVSPISGWAYTVEPEAGVEWVRAGGVLAAFAVGFPAVWWLRTHGRGSGRVALRVFLWFLAVSTVVGGLAYMSGEPLMRLAIGGDATGDWDRVYQALGVPLFLPFLVFGAACAWFMARMMEEARLLTNVLPTPLGRRGPMAAFWTLWAPGLLLTLAYAAVGSGALGPAEWRNIGTGIAGMILIAVAGWIWLRIGRGIRRPSPDSAPASVETPRLNGLSAAMLLPIALVPIVFGPFERAQRGVLIGGVDEDRYDLVAQSLEVYGETMGGGRVALEFRSFPLRGTGSPLRRRLTEQLSERGPSGAAATTLTRFVSSWNLDGAEVVEVSGVRRNGGGWAWDAVIEPPSDRVMVRLWPLTMFAESHISAFDLDGLEGARSFTTRGAVINDGNRILWRRGSGSAGIDSLEARLP